MLKIKYVIFLILSTLTLLSCNNNKTIKTYYTNGKLKEKYNVDKENRKNGKFTEYFNDGTKKSIQFFAKDSLIDTSYYFYKGTNQVLKNIIVHSDSVTLQKSYYKNGNPTSEGKLLNDSIRIGKWSFYDTLGVKKEIIEYFNISGKSYVNQHWILNRRGDTVKGNYYSLVMKDSIKKSKRLRVYFFLSEPAISNDSELFVCIPKLGERLNNDFSNLSELKYDTIQSLAFRYKNRVQFEDRNHDVIFDIEPSEEGNRSLKGFLVEKGKVNKIDSIDFYTRNIYFDIPYFVIDNGTD